MPTSPVLDADTPVGFGSIRLIFDLDSPADAATLDDLVATTERDARPSR